MENTMKFLACNQTVKVTCVDTTELVKKAVKIHSLNLIATKIFGEILTISAILGADLKEKEDNLTVQIDTRSIMGKIICVCKMGAKVKGYIQNPNILDEDIFDQNMQMNIIKDMGLKEPYIGIVEIENRNIANAFTEYFAKSEQVPTAISIGVTFKENGEINKAGGYMIQLLPDAEEETIDLIEKNVKAAKPMTKMLEEGLTLTRIAKELTSDEDILTMLAEIKNEYLCDCTRERFEKGLISLGKEELQKIIDEGKETEVVCHFCNKKYVFEIEDVKRLLEEAK